MGLTKDIRLSQERARSQQASLIRTQGGRLTPKRIVLHRRDPV